MTDPHVNGWDPQGIIPNPGSIEAFDQGCRCARMDNSNGLGYRYSPNRLRVWVTSEGCELHWGKR